METVVDRVTRFTLPSKLGGKEFDYVVLSLANKLNKLPEMLRRSLTCDRASELTSHGTIDILAEVKINFCGPQGPLQFGTNENTNGIHRQYFPNGTDVTKVPVWVMQGVQDDVFLRPITKGARLK